MRASHHTFHETKNIIKGEKIKKALKLVRKIVSSFTIFRLKSTTVIKTQKQIEKELITKS